MSSDFPHRRSIRLKDYDYSQKGAYFITICTQDREYLFGEVINGETKLNECGNIAKDEWINLPKRFSNIELDLFVIMPNHIHGIITVGAPLAGALLNNGDATRSNNNDVRENSSSTNINENNIRINRATARVAPTHMGNIVGAYKSLVYTTSLKINISNNEFQGKIWQRNFYEHIVRDEGDLNRIREYIIDNPVNWNKDDLFIS